MPDDDPFQALYTIDWDRIRRCQFRAIWCSATPIMNHYDTSELTVSIPSSDPGFPMYKEPRLHIYDVLRFCGIKNINRFFDQFRKWCSAHRVQNLLEQDTTAQ